MKRMTVKEAAEQFFNGSVSEGLLYKKIKQKELPHVRMAPGKILLDEESLLLWWDNQLALSMQTSQELQQDNLSSVKNYGQLRRIAE